MTDDASTTFQFDIALSFAGENRTYAADVAERLRGQGVRVFYDQYEQAMLWGKNLYDHLEYVYRRAARYCVLFISEHYADKVWTNHERQSAQARALEENHEYVLRSASMTQKSLACAQPSVMSMLDTQHQISSFT